ncbi:MAG: hypothetical protein V1843_04260 [bacterium]
MMNAEIAGMSLVWLLFVALFLGFAYLVYATASKEKGAVKIAGITLACVIAVLVIISSLYCVFWGGKMGCPMTGKGMMGKGMMMDKDMKCKMMNKDMMTNEKQKGIKELNNK